MNAVTQALKDVAQGTADPKLPMEPQDIAMLVSPVGAKQKPYLVVRLPQEPYSSNVWGGSSNLKNGQFIVDVDVVGEVTPDRAQPYGNEMQMGILNLADDVMDVLENARAALIASSPKVVDYEVTAAAHQQGEDARTIAVTIRLLFKTRFFAGAR